MTEITTLRQAQRIIVDLARMTSPETIRLEDALGRIPVRSVKSFLPVPSFNASTMDGFAANSHDIARAKRSGPVELRVCGEIPAGRTDIPRLSRGQTFRIMTGAAVPPGSDLVLAQEDVEIEPQTIKVCRPSRAGTNIRSRGCELGKGRIIIKRGEIVDPVHLGLLATAGVNDLQVHKLPEVAVICTGSELVEPGKTPETGQVISSNCLLLKALAQQCGAIVRKVSILPDRCKDIQAGLDVLLAEDLPLIITTGGMGPGDYDLMAEVFRKMRIKTVYSSLEVRPGRATMLGFIGKSLLMALPGPPPAVRILFNELARPAIRKISGDNKPLGFPFKAELIEQLTVRSGGILHLKVGVFSVRSGEVKVRLAKKTERANCVMRIPAGKSRFRSGEKIPINPLLPGI